MFFILSKILFYLLMPATWITGTLGFALFTKKTSHRKYALAIGFTLFVFFSNIWIVNQAFLLYETPPTEINKLPEYELGIVLTGVINPDKEPRDRVYFNKGADRVLHTIQLYKEHKLKKILITGGSGRVTGEKFSEGIELKKVFLLCGVPDSVLFVEPDSRNTHENAVYSKRVLDSLGIKGNMLLITSAFHMPRSKGCFDKVGLTTTPYAVDFYGGQVGWTPDVWLVPNERAIGGWNTLIHEWLGYLMYKLMGYS